MARVSGASSGQITGTVPLPAGASIAANQQTDALTNTELRATAVPVSGTVAATQSGPWNVSNVSGTVSLPTGASTSAKQLLDNHNVTVSNMIPAVETGLATSAKQLADNHQVTVSNPTADPETGLAKEATLTDSSQITKIKETVPTDALNNNAPTALGYDIAGNLTTITETIATVEYQTTLTYVSGVLTNISEAVEL